MSSQKFPRNFRDVVDKVYKPEYKWEMRRKNRYGMDKVVKRIERTTAGTNKGG